MAVQLQLLGVPRLLVDGRTVAISWTRRTLELLTYLFTSRGAQPRDLVAFALWPDEDEDAARANLRRNLNELRGLLPQAVTAWIVADSGTIEFRHDEADTDVAAFEARDLDAVALRQAVSAYGGDFAAPLDEAWVLTERERLRARFHAVLTDLVGVEFSARRFDAALVYARRMLADEPLREDVLRRVMSIRYAMGDRPGALVEFERFSRMLRAELSIDPMPETCGLRDLVLRNEALPFAPDAAFAHNGPGVATVTPLLPFTGRATALQRLSAAWRAASAGDGSVVFLGGEAGIGKTRTVAEFLERIAGGSARIFRGTTASPEAHPYEALLRAFGQAAPFVRTLDLEPVWLAALAPLVPEFGALCDPVRARATLPHERETTRLFESFARFARALAVGRSVVIVLEDLHWSGNGTFDALRHLAAQLHGRRVLILATYRTDESSAIDSLVRDLCLSRHADAIVLSRLRPDETLDMLGHVRPSMQAGVAEEIVRRSEGHPLFLTELLREMSETSDMLAGGIAQIVCARLERCSADARALAHMAALCGATFDLDLLQRVAGWDDGVVIDGLAELLQRQFIRSTATHERGSYAFSHALVQNAVAGAMDALEQRRIHHIVARALEARAAGARYDVEIARHWTLAAEPQRAARAYLRAAVRSLDAHARDEAADLAAHGLAVTSDTATHQALLNVRIEANLRRTPAVGLRIDAASLARLADASDEAAQFAVALLRFRIEEVSGDWDSRRDAADALRAFQAAAVPLRSAQIADADAKNALIAGAFNDALGFAAVAHQIYAALGETRDELRLSMFVAHVQARLGRLTEALDELERLEPRVMAFGESALMMDYWYARMTVPHAQRDMAATSAAAERLRELAQSAGDRLMEGHALTMIAAAYQHASALTSALRALERADEIYRSIGASIARASSRNNQASLLLQIGRIAQATTLLHEMYAEAKANDAGEKLYFAASNLGCALLANGEVEESLRLQSEAVTLARSMGSDGFAALALGDLGAAETLAQRHHAGLAHLLEAASLNRRLKRPAVLAHDLARAAAAAPRERGASFAREALAIVEADPGRIALAPEILSRCALAFERDGDTAAARYCRRRGSWILQERLTAIEGSDRDYYLALPWHVALGNETSLDANGKLESLRDAPDGVGV